MKNTITTINIMLAKLANRRIAICSCWVDNVRAWTNPNIVLRCLYTYRSRRKTVLPCRFWGVLVGYKLGAVRLIVVLGEGRQTVRQDSFGRFDRHPVNTP